MREQEESFFEAAFIACCESQKFDLKCVFAIQIFEQGNTLI